MNKHILWTILGLLVIALFVWFLIAQTEVDGQLNDETAQVSLTADTDYSDDIARAEQEFALAAAEVEANIEAGTNVTTEELNQFVNRIEREAQELGAEAEVAYANFISSARATIEALESRIPDVDVDVEVNETEDGDTSAAN